MTRFLVCGPLVAAALALAACGTDGGRPNAGPGGQPAPDVEILTLEPQPIERTTEYIGTVKSRSSTTIQPQVEGFITRIAVRSGDHVRRGDPLLEIDPGRQRALAASLESVRAAREADLDYARQQAERQRILLDAGAASAQEYEQAETALRTAEAQLRAAGQQVEEERVQLAYYSVTASLPGIVGDVPVRVGDRVTSDTVLTTLDSGSALELYLSVPVGQVAGLAPGLAVKLIDDAGSTLLATAIDFVSPQVDGRTQSVLAKAPLPDGAGLRSGQLVRAHIVWREENSLTVPVTAVSRINGRYFAFVAEEADGQWVARQRALRLGPIVGDDYLVTDGLRAGERLIVSGVQKISDGTPVRIPTAAS